MTTNPLPTGTIAVGVDGSPSSRLALSWAVDEARAEHRPLTLVHAVGPVDGMWADQEGWDTRIGRREVRTRSGVLLDEARDQVEQLAPGLEVHQMMRVADPRVVLLEVSQRSAMLVVGSRGRGPVRSLLLGSVSVAVTRHAACPVVVVRPGNPGLVRNGVLVGVDATERSGLPLELAFRQASQRGLPLTVLHAFADTRPDDLEEERALLAETVSGMGEKYPDVPVRAELASGPADTCLITMAARMNLVVVGAHHGGSPSAARFGTVTASVVEHATCPVAVVPVSPA